MAGGDTARLFVLSLSGVLVDMYSTEELMVWVCVCVGKGSASLSHGLSSLGLGIRELRVIVLEEIITSIILLWLKQMTPAVYLVAME